MPPTFLQGELREEFGIKCKQPGIHTDCFLAPFQPFAACAKKTPTCSKRPPGNPLRLITRALAWRAGQPPNLRRLPPFSHYARAFKSLSNPCRHGPTSRFVAAPPVGNGYPFFRPGGLGAGELGADLTLRSRSRGYCGDKRGLRCVC